MSDNNQIDDYNDSGMTDMTVAKKIIALNSKIAQPKEGVSHSVSKKQKDDRQRIFAYFGLFITPLFWAGNFLLSRMASMDITPLSLSFWRWLFALIIILPFGYQHIKREQSQIKQQLWPLLILSALGIATYNSLLYIAAHSTTAINMTLFAAALPIMTILLAWKLINVRPSRYQFIGVIFAVFGFLIIMTNGSLISLTKIGINEGDFIMIIATFCWALYSVLFKKWQIKLHPLTLLTVLISFGLTMITPFYLYDLLQYGGFKFESQILYMFIFLAIFPSILAFFFWNKGVATLGPSVTAIFMYLVPLFTAILSITFLGESLNIHHIIGGLAIMIGVFIATIINDKKASNKFANTKESIE